MRINAKEVEWLNKDRAGNPLTKEQWEKALDENSAVREYLEKARGSGEIRNWIVPVVDEATVSAGALCQDSAAQARSFYVPCNAPAVAVVRRNAEDRGYYMCLVCADRNLREGRGKLMATTHAGLAKRYNEGALVKNDAKAL